MRDVDKCIRKALTYRADVRKPDVCQKGLKCVHNGIASRWRYARATALEKSEVFWSRANIVQIMVE